LSVTSASYLAGRVSTDAASYDLIVIAVATVTAHVF